MTRCEDPAMSPDEDLLACTLEEGHPGPLHEDQRSGWSWSDNGRAERT
jgi:hypothetical protein